MLHFGEQDKSIPPNDIERLRKHLGITETDMLPRHAWSCHYTTGTLSNFCWPS